MIKVKQFLEFYFQTIILLFNKNEITKMAIFNFSAKLDEKLIDDVTVLDKIIKLVVVIGFSYLFSQNF